MRPKKSYEAPVVRVVGSLQELTLAIIGKNSRPGCSSTALPGVTNARRQVVIEGIANQTEALKRMDVFHLFDGQ